MRIGVIEIIELPTRGVAQSLYRLLLTKQFASVMPQAIAAWCRQMGHEVTYGTYYGLGDVRSLLPCDADLVFLSCYTRTSPLAYATAKLLRRGGTMTVVGGPHARAFPHDCLRFFDIAVGECDADLVGAIVKGEVDRGSIVSSTDRLEGVPSVAQRLPEIRRAAYYGSRRPWFHAVPLLSSTGCPHDCDFCVEHERPYRVHSLQGLAEDLATVRRELPGALVAFHDANFAVRFDETMAVLEAVPAADRVPYMMECSLGVLRDDRMDRLRDTRCVFTAPGIESWYGFAGKAGTPGARGPEKMARVAAHLRLLQQAVPIVQVNLIVGLDSDEGDDAVQLTKAFMDETPSVWTSFTVATPFGGTPLFERLNREGRILATMPFGLYDTPYLAVTLANQDPVTFYEGLIDLLTHATDAATLLGRLMRAERWSVRAGLALRTAAVRARASTCRQIVDRLRSDARFRAFHEGRSRTLPSYYRRVLDRRLGAYAELLSDEDLRPRFDASARPMPDGGARRHGAVS